MTYQIDLIHADIPQPMNGTMRLGLMHHGVQLAELNYHWDDKQFSAVFVGHAPSLPHPAHPVELLQKPIAAIQALRTPEHARPTDVFRNHQVTIVLEEQA